MWHEKLYLEQSKPENVRVQFLCAALGSIVQSSNALLFVHLVERNVC